MKITNKILIIVFCILALSSCSFDWTGVEFVDTKLAIKRNVIDITTYNKEAYLRPIWNTREIYDETVSFIGPDSSCTLLYAPTEIISVKNSSLNIEYKEGIDYRVVGNKIYRLEGSSIPYLNLTEIFPSDYTGKQIWTIKSAERFADYGISVGDGCLVSDGINSVYINNMICVSYSHESENVLSIPEDQSVKANSLFQKLENNEAVRILFYGDSITVGCSSSGRLNTSPFVPIWPKIVFDCLKESFSNTNAVYLNTAAGGWSTVDGIDNFNSEVLNQNADVLFIAFGANNAYTLTSDYKAHIKQMCDNYLNSNEDGLIVLVSPMLLSTLYYKEKNSNLLSFENAMKELAKDNNHIIYCPVTTLFKELLDSGVDTIDYLANNVNHPNDFATRLYAQVILKSLMGDKYYKEEWIKIITLK